MKIRDLYDVFPDGRIQRKGSKKCKVPTVGPDGYCRVTFSVQNKAICKTVHSVIAEAFLGPRPDGCEVNHKDGDKKNNKVENLEYVTRSENLLHRSRVLGIGRGESNSQAKITAEVVRQIRDDHCRGMGYKRLAAKYGLSWGLVRDVATRRTWAHEN